MDNCNFPYHFPILPIHLELAMAMKLLYLQELVAVDVIIAFKEMIIFVENIALLEVGQRKAAMLNLLQYQSKIL